MLVYAHNDCRIFYILFFQIFFIFPGKKVPPSLTVSLSSLTDRMDYYNIDTLLALNNPVTISFETPFPIPSLLTSQSSTTGQSSTSTSSTGQSSSVLLPLYQCQFFLLNGHCSLTEIVSQETLYDLHACAGLVTLPDHFWRTLSLLHSIDSLDKDLFIRILSERIGHVLKKNELLVSERFPDVVGHLDIEEREMIREGWRVYQLYN